ncbi:MAG: formylglycine-generating enzyme family protein [Pseudomonadota bacterium]
MTDGQCCTPERGADAPPPEVRTGPCDLTFSVAAIPGGDAMVGTSSPQIVADEEGPLRRAKVKPFKLMTTTVTTEMFAAFIEATDYETEAERFGWSFVFYADAEESAGYSAGAEWWRGVEGANWSAQTGPGSEAVPLNPVTHVSWRDAQAFAKWAGGRLPKEAEWEHAARGGLGDVPFPWGDEDPQEDGFTPCNIWQGVFPTSNSGADGYPRLAPAESFAPNGYGLYNMVGNVWEWTADPFRLRSLSREAKARAAATKGQRLLKGGSFMCHKSYCYRYRIAARIGNTPDSTTAHTGFRLAFDR